MRDVFLEKSNRGREEKGNKGFSDVPSVSPCWKRQGCLGRVNAPVLNIEADSQPGDSGRRLLQVLSP